ncbi:glycerate kinase type-2 family protein [Mangrovitalea sediminis]|uniref:glycerate kinase type-2 family protein n=1 Tax=Mangrovitalea sediminis TaxID=1982043 RepID=UPI0018E9F243|nr:glycerate kinase [Mangrovitalea sediminis]
MNPNHQRRQHLDQIFRAALARVDPFRMIADHVRLDGSRLLVELEGERHKVDLNDYRRLLILGAGKASAPMVRAFEQILGDRIDGGLVCVKYGHAEPTRRVEIVEAGHPVPDANGEAAAKRIAGLAQAADSETLVITCMSGGGSALLPSPLQRQDGSGLTLEDKQQTTRALLSCGADITEINCLRKHLSGLKGGRFVQMLSPARSLNFILSDVIGDDLGSIASGITSADETTFADALAVIDRYGLRNAVPAVVVEMLEAGVAGKVSESAKPGDPALARAENFLIGTNRQALLAAAGKARELGYHVIPLTAQMAGEARHVARTLADIGRDMACSDMLSPKPACLLVGGETVVTLQGEGKGEGRGERQGEGKGGRNQEMALAFLQAMTAWKDAERERVHFLAASTDGNDGPTDAAGGFADRLALEGAGTAARKAIAQVLARHDSYHFLGGVGALYKTGPTNTNVGDLQMLLVV